MTVSWATYQNQKYLVVLKDFFKKEKHYFKNNYKFPNALHDKKGSHSKKSAGEII